LKRKKSTEELDENQIDLNLVRGSTRDRSTNTTHGGDTTPYHHHSRPSHNSNGGGGTSTGLTCPQLLALSGALGALPQVALGLTSVSGIPDWGELSSSLKKAQPVSLSAPVLTLTPCSAGDETCSVNKSPENTNGHECNQQMPQHKSRYSSTSDLFSISHRGNNNNMGPARLFIRRIVESNIFQRGILIAILFNTLSMGIEYHDQVSVYNVWENFV